MLNSGRHTHWNMPMVSTEPVYMYRLHSLPSHSMDTISGWHRPPGLLQTITALPSWPAIRQCSVLTVYSTLHVIMTSHFSLKDLADALKSPHHWLALHISGQGRVSYTCYIIRCPLSSCILLAGIRKPHLSWIMDVSHYSTCVYTSCHVYYTCWTTGLYLSVFFYTSAIHMRLCIILKYMYVCQWKCLLVFQALCLTIECSEWRDLELSGRSLNSLLDLLLNQASQVRPPGQQVRSLITVHTGLAGSLQCLQAESERP